MAQKLYNWLNRPTLWQENEALDAEQLRRFNGVLEHISLCPFERDRRLKTLINELAQLTILRAYDYAVCINSANICRDIIAADFMELYRDF